MIRKWTTCIDLNIELCKDCFARANSNYYMCSDGCYIMKYIGDISYPDDPNTMANLHYHSIGLYSLKDKFAHIIKFEELHLRKALEIAHPEYLPLLYQVINERTG